MYNVFNGGKKMNENEIDELDYDAELDYDIENHMKFYWYDTDSYELNRDNNNGYIFGILSWFGQFNNVDFVADYHNDCGTNIQSRWFKTKQERDKAFKNESGRKFKRFSTVELKENKS